MEKNKNPFLTIWISPRATIRRIVDSDPRRLVLILAMLGGFSAVLDKASIRSVGDIFSLPEIFIICAILGPIVGIIGLYVSAFLLKWTGKWIGGQGSLVDIRAAIAWSNVPIICALVLWIPKLALFGEELFTSETPNILASPLLALLFLGFGIIDLVIAIWAIIIFLKCLAEVQRFSTWKALGNAIITLLVIIIPVFILVLLFASL